MRWYEGGEGEGEYEWEGEMSRPSPILGHHIIVKKVFVTFYVVIAKQILLFVSHVTKRYLKLL